MSLSTIANSGRPPSNAPTDGSIKNELGVVGHKPNSSQSHLINELGVHWVRYTLGWNVMNNQCSSNISIRSEDKQKIDRLLRNGKKIMITMEKTADCGSLRNTDNIRTNDIPRPELYARYVRKVVSTLRRKGIRHFNIWNEPDLEQFFEGNPKEFVQYILEPGYQALKQGCQDAGQNDCLLLGPELSHSGDFDKYMEELFKEANKRNIRFDIITHHIYKDHDKQIWDGDTFTQALEKRRFAFTNPSLIDLLDDAGYTGKNRIPNVPVWITETGYKAPDLNNAKELNNQRNYLKKVIQLQLERNWWTNTFIYEIQDPGTGDTIFGFDGQGLTRKDSRGQIQLKPAFHYVREELKNNPKFVKRY